MTFVFATYFSKAVAVNPTEGAAQWGWAMALSGLLIAALSPILGAAADHVGRRERWIAIFTAIMAVASAGLWWVTPDPSSILLCLALVVIANVCFETATVFYNALLPNLVPAHRIGRISGWAWGLGYGGGLCCLITVLFGLIKADPPPFGLNPDVAEPVRASALLVAIWLITFTLPFWFWVRDPKPGARQTSVLSAITGSFGFLMTSIRSWPAHLRIGRFLLARMIYTDGLNTLFAFGGIYASGTFGLSLSDVIAFGIALNVSAGLGAAAFGWLDDRIGPKRVILISLAAMIGIGSALVLISSVTWFWLLGVCLGVFLGPVQAASRSFMAHIAPAKDRGACFGLFALSGKITAFLGPAVLALTTDIFDSQRAGMATILIFLILGACFCLQFRQCVPKTNRKAPVMTGAVCVSDC